MRGRVLVLQHLACEHPGSLGRQLSDAGMTMHTVELDEGGVIPDLAAFDVMVVMGGPMDVWQTDGHPWLNAEKEAIRAWVQVLQRPYLGVCLGHQLLADALGGEVGLMETPEIGVCQISVTPQGASDPLFGALPSPIRGLQWHGAQVRRLPARSVLLATNPACTVQAFRVGPCAWGVQFHMEVLDSTVEEWAQVPEYLDALAQAGVTDVAALHGAVSRELAGMQAATAAVARRLVGVVERAAVSRQAAPVSPS
jgi:GMP synthase-like glutamine amidotransferase